MECYPKNENVSREDKGILVKKCMSLTMECIRAHIFVAEKVQSQRMEGGMEICCHRGNFPAGTLLYLKRNQVKDGG